MGTLGIAHDVIAVEQLEDGMNIRIATIAGSLCLAASGAMAAPLSADVARMDRMIHDAHAEEVVFNGTTTSDELVAIHQASGLRCRFLLGLGDLTYIPDEQAILCSMKRSTFNYALSAFPARAGESIDSVQAELRSNLVHGRATTDIPISKIETAIGATPGTPPFVASRFRVGDDYMRIAVVRSGDWWITSAARSSQPPDIMQATLQAAEWNDVLKGVSAPLPPADTPPPGTGP
jgi:hypothetical protein